MVPDITASWWSSGYAGPLASGSDPTMEETMSRRPRGKLAKEIHDPAAPDVRKPRQPHVPKFKAGKKRDPSARPPKA
jgi:hypothetical protein